MWAAALRRGLGNRIRSVNCSMAELPYSDHSFDVIWAEGSACNIGFDTALRSWRRLLAPGGVLVVTECEWTTDTPSPEARAFWDAAYPLRTAQENVAARPASVSGRAGERQPRGRHPDHRWHERFSRDRQDYAVTMTSPWCSAKSAKSLTFNVASGKS
ncbi:MAG: class I SAM-dependent methyltransferase [Pseudonocardiales bacterium]